MPRKKPNTMTCSTTLMAMLGNQAGKALTAALMSSSFTMAMAKISVALKTYSVVLVRVLVAVTAALAHNANPNLGAAKTNTPA